MHDLVSNSSLPHRPGAMPMDDENKQRLDAAKQEKKVHEKVGEKCSKFLIRISDEIDSVDREKRLSLFRSQIKAHQYMDGNFQGYVDQNLEWQTRAKQEGEVWYSDNQLYPYWRTALMELSRTQTEVIINAPPGASDEIVSAAKFAKARYDANRDRTFNSRLKQTENSYALLNGITFRYTYPNYAGARKEQIPTLNRQEQSGEKSKLCALCVRPVIGDKCVSCGSEMFLELEASEGADTVIGYENVPTCENAWTVPNPIGVIVSLQASCIEETPFIKWKQLILRSVLQSKFKGMELPTTGTESIELRYTTNQQTSTPGGTSSGSDYGSTPQSEGRELELLEFQQVWLDYPVYCDVKFEEDTPLSRGKTLKAGQPLGEMYPKGLYFAKCGDLILDMWNEDKNRKWTSSPYGMRAGSMYGSGSSQALQDQEKLNDIDALTMANAWSNGVPREFVDPNHITELSADPQIPTNVVNSVTDGNIIGRAYAVAPPQSLSNEIYAMAEIAKGSMQNKIGAMSNGAGGLADSQKWGDTATAISIKRDLAVGRFSPDLELMADNLDRMQAYQFLENEQEFFTPGQWKKQKGEHSSDAVKAFLECDIRRDLIITINPGSYMPKSDAQIQAKLVAYTELIPLLAQTNNPEVLAYAAETFGIPEHLGGWASDRSHADKVIKRFQALAEVFIEQFGDLPTNALDPETVGVNPQTGEPIQQPSRTMIVAQRINDMVQMPVDVFLDNHQALQDAYRDWRTTDEGQEAPNVMLATVALRVNLHQEGIAKQGQIMARTAQAAEEPIKEEMAAEQTKMLEAENAATAAQAEQTEVQMQAQAAEKLMQFADADDARAAEAEKQQAQHDHETKLKVLDIAAQPESQVSGTT